MKLSQVAVQLYTLRDHCKTAAELAATLKKVRAIGYEAVQVSGVGPIPPAEIAAIARDAGVVICATHEDGKMILNEPEKVVEKLRALGTLHTAYPWPADINFTDKTSLDTLCRKLDAAGEVLASAGLTLSYHNHSLEFVKAPNGQIALDYIFERTRAAFVKAEIDTYWVAAGGVDPVGYLRKFKGRLPLIHLKDFKVLPDGKGTFSEVGAGNLDFGAIIEVAQDAGCEWFIVEQDTCPGDPFDSIRQSFDYLTENHVCCCG